MAAGIRNNNIASCSFSRHDNIEQQGNMSLERDWCCSRWDVVYSKQECFTAWKGSLCSNNRGWLHLCGRYNIINNSHKNTRVKNSKSTDLFCAPMVHRYGDNSTSEKLMLYVVCISLRYSVITISGYSMNVMLLVSLLILDFNTWKRTEKLFKYICKKWSINSASMSHHYCTTSTSKTRALSIYNYHIDRCLSPIW